MTFPQCEINNVYLILWTKERRWRKKVVDHRYLGYEALCDGHRVGVALLEIMKKIPETNTELKEIRT